jgi:cyclic-di-GMP-binding protein
MILWDHNRIARGQHATQLLAAIQRPYSPYGRFFLPAYTEETPPTRGEGSLMAGDFSFDIVSDFDRQELVNAVDQTQREMAQRYDLKSTKSTLDLEKDAIVITAPADITLRSIVDVLESKMIRRDLDIKILDPGPVEQASGGNVRQRFTLKRGISQDLAKRITKLIRDTVPKAKAQIQGDAVRVSSKSKDDLQQVIQTVRQQGYDVPLQYQNYR